MSYCTVKQVKDFTGHKAEDFGQTDPGAFDAKVAEWIEDAEGIVNADRKRTFDPVETDVQYAGLLRTVTMQIVSNLMEIALAHRASPIKAAEDPEDKPPPGGPVTSAVRGLLDMLPKASVQIGLMIVGENDSEL